MSGVLGGIHVTYVLSWCKISKKSSLKTKQHSSSNTYGQRFTIGNKTFYGIVMVSKERLYIKISTSIRLLFINPVIVIRNAWHFWQINITYIYLLL